MRYSQVKEGIEDLGRADVEEWLEKLGDKTLAECIPDIRWIDLDEAYRGEHRSDEDFVSQLLEDTGSIPKDLPNYIYIDWERTANDVMMDYSSYNGHYFRIL